MCEQITPLPPTSNLLSKDRRLSWWEQIGGEVRGSLDLCTFCINFT